jgi:hypothetical protein
MWQSYGEKKEKQGLSPESAEGGSKFNADLICRNRDFYD